MSFLTTLSLAIAKNNSLLCIGLDTEVAKIPSHLQSKPDAQFQFNQAIIDDTSRSVCCYKVNIAFYSAQGVGGLEALIKTITYIHDNCPGIPVILDAKRADIENTSKQYAKEVFDVLGADAVTVNPYLGFDALEPFLKRKDKGIFILCRTSNLGAKDLQDTKVSREFHLRGGTAMSPREESEPLYLLVAKKVVQLNKKYGNCALVVGAAGEEVGKIRDVAPDMFFLVPGIGLQGGDLKRSLANGLTKEKSGLIIHAARSIIYASNGEDFANAARSEAEKLRDEINTYRL